MSVKKCTKCGEEKKLTEFYKNKRMSDGRQSQCKICMRGSYTSSRNKKKEHYNKVRRDRKNNKLQKWREWKEQQGCKFCDETFGPCLQLHHLVAEEKEKTLSDLVASDANWERVMKEAKKCVVVCGNCHIKIHYGIIPID